ncbi:ribonuclease HII [Corynebacterium poyangense]|uniref:Ribonuclease HII n=1 Tax=Corynebacterium poyangense TaxID=2684405 RepID=A0A7H0SPJ5_9CORY|nr:ribonuclease HII [Corynebacterium poyangense]MBZ8178055.1 ribonuclease HII [Corynebacterium poyangense]QNQ90470.1 ribonuclease HII [Corynebacterium poyangense]
MNSGRVRNLKHLRTYEVALSKADLGPVAGVDEAGRGACCGPMTVAACVLPDEPIQQLATLTDSKKLTAQRRALLAPLIKKYAISWSIIHIPAADIDLWGIQHANISGMRRAVTALDLRPGYVLIDAMRVPGLTIPSLPIIGGDGYVRCIAAASVLAKQARDELMVRMDQDYPEYGLKNHKGYGTSAHLEAVRRHGACPEHRYSYANIKAAHHEWLNNQISEEKGNHER